MKLTGTAGLSSSASTVTYTKDVVKAVLLAVPPIKFK